MGNFKYTNEHECIHVDNDIAWVGISKYAQDALGDLVYVELPETGQAVKKGESFAVVESVKTAADVYSPVDGEVIETNEALSDNFEKIAEAVNEGGWIAKIKITGPDQLSSLMDEAKYKEYLESID